MHASAEAPATKRYSICAVLSALSVSCRALKRPSRRAEASRAPGADGSGSGPHGRCAVIASPPHACRGQDESIAMPDPPRSCSLSPQHLWQPQASGEPANEPRAVLCHGGCLVEIRRVSQTPTSPSLQFTTDFTHSGSSSLPSQRVRTFADSSTHVGRTAASGDRAAPAICTLLRPSTTPPTPQ